MLGIEPHSAYPADSLLSALVQMRVKRRVEGHAVCPARDFGLNREIWTGTQCDDPFAQIQEHEALIHCFDFILLYHSLMSFHRLDCLNCLCYSVTQQSYAGNLQTGANTESQCLLSWGEYNSQIPWVGIPDLQSNSTQYLLSVSLLALPSQHTCWEVHLEQVSSVPPRFQLQVSVTNAVHYKTWLLSFFFTTFCNYIVRCYL